MSDSERDRALAHRASSREAFDAGDLARAAREAGHAIEAMEKAVGTAHADYAMMLVNFAALSVEGGEYSGSIELCRRAIAIYEHTADRDDEHAIALRVASLAHRALGQLPRAHELLVRALDLVKDAELGRAIESEIDELS